MDKHYYLMINMVNHKFDSTLDVIVFNKRTEASLYERKLLKQMDRKLSIDERNNGIANPDLYLVLNDSELVYVLNAVVKLRRCKLTDKLDTIYKLNLRQFKPEYTNSNISKIKKFIDSIPKKIVKETKTTSDNDVVILYDENWNPIGCTKVWNR